MKRVFVIHGWDGSPNSNWFPWLKAQIEKFDVNTEVHLLKMPNAAHPLCDEWVEFLSKSIGESDSNTYLVGHSLGVITISRYLETLENQKVGGVILVAGFAEKSENPELATFVEKPVDFNKVKSASYNFVVIDSDNDPYISLENGKILEEKLGAKRITISEGGHLNEEFGITKLEEVFEAYKSFFTEEVYERNLKEDGFLSVYRWYDEPNTVYKKHKHKGKGSFYVVDGSVTFTSGFNKTVNRGEKFDVTPEVEHEAGVGDLGCRWVVGEEIEGDM